MTRQRKRSVHGGGSVYQRKSDGRWVAKFKVEETGRYRELYAQSEKEAYKKLQEALFEQKQGILATGPQQTVKQFLEYWLEDVYKGAVRLSTYENGRVIVNKHLVPGIGHIKLQKLTTQALQSFYAKKTKAGTSASRIRAIHVLLHKALDHAKRIKLVGSNVCDGVELPKLTKPKAQSLTPEQAQLLLQKGREHHHLEALLTLALATGMRKGEILGLRWADVDLEKGTLQVHRTLNYMAHHGFVEGEPKTESSRRQIMLPPFVVETLRRHRTAQLEVRLAAGANWVDYDLVFSNKRGGFIYHSLLYHFYRLLEEVGLPHMRFHDLRHSAATLLLSMGVPAKVVQELLGHSTINMTMNRYSHVLPSMQKEAVDKMDLFLRQQS